MRIWLRPDRMNALNVTSDDVAQALREQNVQGAAGQVGTPPVFNGQQQTLTINGLGRLNRGRRALPTSLSARGGDGSAGAPEGRRHHRAWRAQLQLRRAAERARRRPISASTRRRPLTPCSVANAVRAELEPAVTRASRTDLIWEVKFDTTSLCGGDDQRDWRLAGADAAGGGGRGVPVPAELARDADCSAGHPGVAGRHLRGALYCSATAPTP